jgi:hypothetical protein
MGMNLTIILLTCFLIKYLVRWLKNLLFTIVVWFIIFGILAIFYQNDKKSYINLHLIVLFGVHSRFRSFNYHYCRRYCLVPCSSRIPCFYNFKKTFRIPLKSFFDINIRWFLIAMHWVTFFMLSTFLMFPLPFLFSLEFFASILEPLFYGRKVLWYEVFFGLS